MRYGVGLFLLLMTVHSYAMLVNEDSFFKKPKIERPRIERVVRQEERLNMQERLQGLPAKNIVDVSKGSIIAHDFVNNFSHMSFSQAYTLYTQCTEWEKKKVIEAVGKKKNDLFLAAFYMSTQCSADIRNLIVKKLMCSDGDEQSEKIASSAIGELMYRCGLAWNMVQNRQLLMRLPLCTNVLRRHNKNPELHCLKGWPLDEGSSSYLYDRQKELVCVSDLRIINSIFFDYRRHELMYSSRCPSFKSAQNVYEISSASVIMGTCEAQDILGHIVNELVWCSQSDIKDMLHFLAKKEDWSRKELEYFVDFHKKYPFLGEIKRNFHYRRNCSYQGYIYFAKEGAKVAVKFIWPLVLVIPAVVAILSRKVDEVYPAQLRQCECTVVNNAIYTGIVEVLDKHLQGVAQNSEKMVQNGAAKINTDLGQYIKGLVRNPMYYHHSWYDTMKICFSKVIILGTGSVVNAIYIFNIEDELHKKNEKIDYRNLLAGLLTFFVGGVPCMYFVCQLAYRNYDSIETDAIIYLIGSLAIFSAAKIYDKILCDRGRIDKQSFKLSEIEEQLKRKDIEIL